MPSGKRNGSGAKTADVQRTHRRLTGKITGIRSAPGHHGKFASGNARCLRARGEIRFRI